jgi:hypothetical protein
LLSNRANLHLQYSEKEVSREHLREYQSWAYEERIDNRICADGDLIPIEGGDRIESESTVVSSNDGESDVLRCNPGHPVEVTQRLEDEAETCEIMNIAAKPSCLLGEPEINKHATEAV